MYNIKVESDPTCIMAESFYGIILEPYLLSVYREDHTLLTEVKTVNLANKYQEFVSKRITPEFSYIKKNVEIEEAMKIVEEFCSLKRKKRCQI